MVRPSQARQSRGGDRKPASQLNDINTEHINIVAAARQAPSSKKVQLKTSGQVSLEPIVIQNANLTAKLSMAPPSGLQEEVPVAPRESKHSNNLLHHRHK